MPENAAQPREDPATARPSPNSSDEIKSFISTHLYKILGAVMLAAGTGVLAFTTNAVSGALTNAFSGSFKQCAVEWVPVDCPGGANDPSIGICGCEDKRSLGWFRNQLSTFKSAHIPGFDGITDDMTLAPEGADNSRLSFRQPGQATPIWRLGVGYNVLTGKKDWCVHLYRADGKSLELEGPVMCLDQSGRWWSRASDQDGTPTPTSARLLDK